VLGEELAEWTGARCLAASGLSCSATPARAIASSSFGPWESPTRSRLAGARWLAGASPAPSRTFRRIRAQHARTRRRHRIVITSHPPLGSSSLLPACKRARWRSRPRRPHRTTTRCPARRSTDCPSAGKQKPRHANLGLPTRLLRNARSQADRHGNGCPSAPAMQHSGAADGAVSSTVSQVHAGCKQKSSSVDAADQTAGAGAERSRSRPCRGSRPRLLSDEAVAQTKAVVRIRQPLFSPTSSEGLRWAERRLRDRNDQAENRNLVVNLQRVEDCHGLCDSRVSRTLKED
jgi:hypothetical protein